MIPPANPPVPPFYAMNKNASLHSDAILAAIHSFAHQFVAKPLAQGRIPQESRAGRTGAVRLAIHPPSP
jgi:hypothetical protein